MSEKDPAGVEMYEKVLGQKEPADRPASSQCPYHPPRSSRWLPGFTM